MSDKSKRIQPGDTFTQLEPRRTGKVLSMRWGVALIQFDDAEADEPTAYRRLSLFSWFNGQWVLP